MPKYLKANPISAECLPSSRLGYTELTGPGLVTAISYSQRVLKGSLLHVYRFFGEPILAQINDDFARKGGRLERLG